MHAIHHIGARRTAQHGADGELGSAAVARLWCLSVAAGEGIYWQQLVDAAYELRPTRDRIEELKQAAARYAGTAANLLSNEFVVTGVTGASASKLIDGRLGSMRSTLMASRAAIVARQRHAIIAGLTFAARNGYFIGDWASGNWAPRCGSDAALKVFEDEANRRMLRGLIFRNDGELTASIGTKLARLEGQRPGPDRFGNQLNHAGLTIALANPSVAGGGGDRSRSGAR